VSVRRFGDAEEFVSTIIVQSKWAVRLPMRGPPPSFLIDENLQYVQFDEIDLGLVVAALSRDVARGSARSV
jgi:hypothetical protein